MATIQKQIGDGKTSYYVRVRAKGFPMQSATFSRLTDAKNWAEETRLSMEKGKFHEVPKKSYSFEEAA